MTPITQAFKNCAPFILTGAGIGMMTNLYKFEQGLRRLDDPSDVNDAFTDIEGHDEGVKKPIKSAFNASLVAVVCSNVLMGSAKLITNLSLQNKQLASINVIFKNIAPLLIGLNLICGYASVAFKITMIVARLLPQPKSENEELLAIAFAETPIKHKPLIEMGYFALTGALGAAGAVLIHKCFPES